MDGITLALWLDELNMCETYMRKARTDYEYAYWSTRREGAVNMVHLAGYSIKMDERGRASELVDFTQKSEDNEEE